MTSCYVVLFSLATSLEVLKLHCFMTYLFMSCQKKNENWNWNLSLSLPKVAVMSYIRERLFLDSTSRDDSAMGLELLDRFLAL